MRSLPMLMLALAGCLTEEAGVESVDRAAFSVSLGTPDVEASPLLPTRTVTIRGYPHQPVVIDLSRATAGVLSATSLTLDAEGNGSVTFTPCAGVAPTCLGSATITLAIGSPKAQVASQAFTLVYPTQVGEVGPCGTNAKTMFLRGNDFIVDGTFQSASTTPWQVWPATDQVTFEVGVPPFPDRFVGRFSLFQLQQTLSPGIYLDAQREAFAEPGRPGLEVIGRSRGCNIIAGRFQIHDYVADPVDGSVHSATISFEQSCDPEPDFTGLPTMKLMAGCFHYE